MKTYFDEATDKRLLEAKTEEEVKAIIAETPEAEKLADKTDLVMAELKRIKGSVDNELDIDELDSAAGGAKLQHIYLSDTQSCIATFFLNDLKNGTVGFNYCWSNDFCNISNEYEYHNTRYSNCHKGGKHDWESGQYEEISTNDEGAVIGSRMFNGFRCRKCGLTIEQGKDNFDN